MKSVKKYLIIEAIILIVAVLAFLQTTYAYFTFSTKTSATITSGNVSILLSEAAVKRDAVGNLVEDTEKTRVFGSSSGTIHEYGIIYPGQLIYKDPTIQNTGNNDAYIAAKMSITDGKGDIHRVIGYENYDEIDMSMLFGGGFFSENAHYGKWNHLDGVTYNDKFAMVQVPNRAEGRYDVYFFILEPASQGESILLFDQMFFSPEYTNDDMKEFAELRIDIFGYAVQAFGFESCYEAMVNALPDYFADLTQTAP